MSDKVDRVKAKPDKNYSKGEKLKFLKRLELNDFNLTKTAQDCGVSVASLKRWREDYPEAFNNTYNSRNLAIVENAAKDETVKIYRKSGGILSKALAQAELLIEMETDLGKVATLIRALTPLATTLKEVDANNGYQKVSSLTATLEKLSALNNKIVDVPYEESK